MRGTCGTSPPGPLIRGSAGIRARRSGDGGGRKDPIKPGVQGLQWEIRASDSNRESEVMNHGSCRVLSKRDLPTRVGRKRRGQGVEKRLFNPTRARLPGTGLPRDDVMHHGEPFRRPGRPGDAPLHLGSRGARNQRDLRRGQPKRCDGGKRRSGAAAASRPSGGGGTRSVGRLHAEASIQRRVKSAAGPGATTRSAISPTVHTPRESSVKGRVADVVMKRHCAPRTQGTSTIRPHESQTVAGSPRT